MTKDIITSTSQYPKVSLVNTLLPTPTHRVKSLIRVWDTMILQEKILFYQDPANSLISNVAQKS